MTSTRRRSSTVTAVALIVFAGAQALDAATMRLTHELNPLVTGLGPDAYLAKLLLVVAVASIAIVLHLPLDGRLITARRIAGRAMLGIGIVAGAFGAWSNTG